MKCPVCENTGVKEARQCPMRDGEPVCEACCRKCSYRGSQGTVCRYYIESEDAKLKEEIKSLYQKLNFQRERARKLWESKKNYAAAQTEAYCRILWQEIKELEKKYERT